ncbi:MAG: methylmalonyl Co-A mutase-associated GTPase MeaB [Saprospiraceae bacterium]
MSKSTQGAFNRNFARKRKKNHSVEELKNMIPLGDLNALSEAMTLIESEKQMPQMLDLLQSAQDASFDFKSKRIAITGSPGVGKSSMIESFGLYLLDKGHRIAVLAIDPSSQISGGSILGDKTRMEKMSAHPNAFIRPSPARDFLGGVASHTKEFITLCEYAKYDYILIETVGVGQSETYVKNITDCTILLLQPGAGDDLQGIKRGIVEIADIVLITKADGEQYNQAIKTRNFYKDALRYFVHPLSNWKVSSLLFSSQMHQGDDELYRLIHDYFTVVEDSGYLSKLRKQQNLKWLNEELSKYIIRRYREKHHINTQEINALANDRQINIYETFSTLISDYKNL